MTSRRSKNLLRNPELLKKGTRLIGSFVDDGTGWRYSGDYPSVRGQRWIASLGLSRGELSVEGATEYDPGFRSSLVQMAAEYPELLGLDVKFDGPRIPIAALVRSDVSTIDRTSWLHGTSSAALDSVMASGLRPRRETGAAAVFVGAAKESRPQYVYLTTQRNMARMAARAAARASGGVPVVLRVEPLPVGRMQPDEDSGMDTAEESLWRIGSVAYEGSIPPSKITVDEVLKDGEWSAPVSSNRRPKRLDGMRASPARWASYLPDAVGYAEAGFHFSEGGCWGMALALHAVLGGSLKVASQHGGTHAWVESDGWAYDDQGASSADGYALRGRTVTASGLLVAAARHGVSRDEVLSDAEWASRVVKAAQELAEDDAPRKNRRTSRRFR